MFHVQPLPTGYEGLSAISQECWRCLAETVYMSSRSVPLQPLIGNSPGVFDDIRYFLQSLLAATSWYNITSWLTNYVLPQVLPHIRAHLTSPFQTFFWSLQAALGGGLASLRDYVNNRLYALEVALGGAVATLRAYLNTRLYALEVTLGGALASVRDYLNTRLYALEVALGGAVATLRAYLNNRIYALEVTLGGAVASLRDTLTSGIAGLSLIIRDPLAGLRAVIERLESSWVGKMSQVALVALVNFDNWVVGFLGSIYARIPAEVLRITANVQRMGPPFLAGLWAGVSSIPAAYLTWISSTCGTDLALHPAQALASVGGLYAISIAAGAAAHLTSTALDLVPTLNWVGASQLSAFVAQAAAFDPLTKACYGTLINDALAIPLRYHWNQQLRPSMPTIGEVYTMGRKHGLSMDEFRTAMSYQGLPDWWITKIYDFFWTDPSPMWLMRMCEGGVPRITDGGRKTEWLDQWIPGWRDDPLAWLRMKLMLAGFEDIDIGPMVEGIRGRSLAPAKTAAKTPVRAMLRDAYWTEDDAAAYLIPLGVRPEEIHSMATAADLDYQHAYLDDQVTYYVAAFAKGEISEQDLDLALSTIYVRPERAAQVIARERIRKLPATKTVTAVKEDYNITRLRTQAINSWIAQYHAWEISSQDLLLGLTVVTRDAVLAGRLLDVELTRFRPTPAKPKAPAEDPLLAAARRQAIATWVEAFRDGEIDNGQLELYLQPLVTSKPVRQQLVALERLRYSPTPELLPPPVENEEIAKVRAEYVRGHIELFARRQIGVEQLYQFLQADGLVEPLARATAITQATKRIKQPSLMSPYYLADVHAELIDAGLQAVEESYAAGEITLAAYEAWLAPLARDQAVVTYLADVLALRKFAGSV